MLMFEWLKPIARKSFGAVTQLFNEYHETAIGGVNGVGLAQILKGASIRSKEQES